MKKILIFIISSAIIGLIIFYFYPDKKLPKDAIIDKIVVIKSQKKLFAYSNGNLLKTYRVAIGSNPIGHKEYQGDKKTPEGTYTINDKNPNSSCCKNLGISYPNSKDLAHAKKIGKPAGGDIKIHGLKNGLGFIGKFHRFFNWTAGCIAVTDSEINELYKHTMIGATIEIKP
ncbi:L,D-transpeptidase family protein [Bacteroidales bacterium OttesenSCG-928-K03]|nr:L,D-transpeptidase family protein [Bacteroidales bacterium OttesenSCG-928-L14]MDL2243147.1 L,D-transpeptidase family protein [Bacteroidales bacterium OttesenSCG-928-K03]